MQWFVMFLVSVLAVVAMQLVLGRRRKAAQHIASLALLRVAAADASTVLPQPVGDLRIAKIISEIPMRRVRQTFRH